MKPTTRPVSYITAPLPHDTTQAIFAAGRAIPNAHLGTRGRESHPHITVKHGIETDDVRLLRALLADTHTPTPPITATLGALGTFPPVSYSDGAAIVRIAINSPGLQTLHSRIKAQLPNTESFSAYTPHITLAYVQPRFASQYQGEHAMTGQAFTLDRLLFKTRNGKTHPIPLDGAPTRKKISEMTKAQRKAFGKSTPHPGRLTEDHRLYFDLSGDHQVIRIDDLIPATKPSQQPSSVHNAAVFMAAVAEDGDVGRGPITVIAMETEGQPNGKYLIADGNATYGAALESGWESIPAQILNA